VTARTAAKRQSRSARTSTTNRPTALPTCATRQPARGGIPALLVRGDVNYPAIHRVGNAITESTANAQNTTAR